MDSGGKKTRAVQTAPMTCEQHKNLKTEEFQQLCGVHKETESRMAKANVLQKQVEQKSRSWET